MPHLLEDRHGPVAVLTMNRPEARNALTAEMFDLMLEALPRLAADPEIGCVVMTGAGGAFCSGGDVKNFVERDGPFDGRTYEQAVFDLRRKMEVARWLHEMPKPTIAMIPGACAGAGLSIAAACDFRMAAEGAKFTVAFANVGLSGDFSGSWFLTRILGTAKARELYLTSRVLLADEAERIGLVHRAVAPEALEEETMTFAKRLAGGPRVALGYMKANLNQAEVGTLAQSLDQEAANMMRCFDTDDHREAARAFVEKRPPKFAGR